MHPELSDMWGLWFSYTRQWTQLSLALELFRLWQLLPAAQQRPLLSSLLQSLQTFYTVQDAVLLTMQAVCDSCCCMVVLMCGFQGYVWNMSNLLILCLRFSSVMPSSIIIMQHFPHSSITSVSLPQTTQLSMKHEPVVTQVRVRNYATNGMANLQWYLILLRVPLITYDWGHCWLLNHVN